MRGFLAQLAKIIRRGHKALPKEVMPYAVDDHARSQGIVPGQHRLGQFQPARLFGLKRLGIKSLKESPRDRFARLLVIASDKERLILGLRFDEARRALGHRYLSFKLAIVFGQSCRLRRGVQGIGQETTAHKMAQEICLRISHGVLLPGLDAINQCT